MKALVLFSGGVDSTTCLGLAVDKYGADQVLALSVSYGQKHQKEVEAAGKIAAHYGVKWQQLDLSVIFADSNCSLLSGSTQEIPKETYAEQLQETNGSPVSTYVPFRNGLFLSSAASIALSNGCEVIYYGAHSDDAAGHDLHGYRRHRGHLPVGHGHALVHGLLPVSRILLQDVQGLFQPILLHADHHRGALFLQKAAGGAQHRHHEAALIQVADGVVGITSL